MKRYAFQDAPRRSATSKRTRKPCQAPAVRGWGVCASMAHVAAGQGGKANGAYRHGIYTAQMIEERRRFSEIVREHREFLAMVSGKRGI